ncbi:MAG TPA: hypothetical protein VH255_08310 [Verrucomicrobiae bacterium]|nr:hypothetical protein [Verrucomicrobiae bacterium]
MPEIKKGFLWSFIGFLSITAVIAIITVLSGTFGDTQLKVLGTTFAISTASICAMSCAAFIEKHGKNIFAFAGMFSAVASAAMSIAGMWGEISGDFYWKTTLMLIVIAIATAYALLLLIPSLAAGHKWTQNAAVACIAVLALEIIAAICGEIDAEGYYRLVIVTSIVTVLMTLVVPICLKLRGKEDGEHFDRLVLHKVADDIYADQSGRRVRVTQIES